MDNLKDINQKEIFKNLIEDGEFQDVLTEEKVQFRIEEEKELHKNNENFIGLTLVYMDFNNMI